MSDKNENSSKNSQKIINNTKQTISESSMYIEDEDHSINMKLSESKNRIFFISKISLLFSLYFFSAFLAIALITICPKESKKINQIFKFEKMIFIFFIAKILLITIFFFLEKKIGKLDKIFFSLNCKLIFFLVFSCYFYLENYLSIFYMHKGHYIFLVTFTLFINSLFFVFSTLLKKKAKIFKPLISLILMSFSSLLSIYLVQKIKKDIFFDFRQIFIFFVYFSAFNIYICINSFFITKFRSELYLDNQYISCYFGFFSDFFYVFWKDFVKNSYFYEKNLLDQEIEKKKNLAKKVLENNNMDVNLVVDNKK